MSKYVLPSLPYNYGALEPYFDALTMEIHHTKHHQAYINNLNAALESYPNLQAKSVEELVSSMDNIPADIKTAVQNHGGGHANHSLFWKLLKHNGGGKPQGPIGQAITKQFESFEAFQDRFNKAALSVFGSGWAWLVMEPTGNLAIIATPNQDSPLMQGKIPLLGLDVWEHAYYLKYQNKRPDYINAWWHIIHWDAVQERFEML